MVFSIKAVILENQKILPDFYRMVLAVPSIAREAEPGQFVMLKTSNTLDPLLKRPISIHRINKAEGTIALVYQVIGRGTKLLSQITQGELEVMGPLGNGFYWKKDYKKVAIVGGGCGIAPLPALAEELVKDGKEVYVLLGAQTREKLLCVADFQQLGCKVQVTTDDGSYGTKGFVTEILQEFILNTKIDQVYCCGPLPMTKGVIKLTKENLIPCQVSLEERMACGIGACLGCACKVRNEDGTITYKKVCHDGPVFASSEVIIDD